MRVTNISEGPRGINTTKGLVILDPNETREDLDVSDAELNVAKTTEWFLFDGKDKVVDNLNSDDEKAKAEAEAKAKAEAEAKAKAAADKK